MYCDYCSSPVDEEEDFCPECGIMLIKEKKAKKDVLTCSVCGAEILPGEKKCSSCCSINFVKD